MYHLAEVLSLLLYSVYCNMLFWLKYLKKSDHIDMQLEKGGVVEGIERIKSDGNKLNLK